MVTEWGKLNFVCLVNVTVTRLWTMLITTADWILTGLATSRSTSFFCPYPSSRSSASSSDICQPRTHRGSTHRHLLITFYCCYPWWGAAFPWSWCVAASFHKIGLSSCDVNWPPRISTGDWGDRGGEDKMGREDELAVTLVTIRVSGGGWVVSAVNRDVTELHGNGLRSMWSKHK
jgi:hypothetical protein